jgi:biotin synthase
MSIPNSKFSEAASRITRDEARAILNGEGPLYAWLARAAEAREEFFARNVRIHILDNIKNGNCAEDCGYCAQRKNAGSGIREYPLKNADEIFAEAAQAKASGAYRFCLVTAGTGPSLNTTNSLAQVISRITNELGLKVCLSAGFVDDSKARVLAEAGLDRYNHNLNTSEAHYEAICSTHTFADRTDTLAALTRAGVGLCSGVIAGLGEKPGDLADAAFALKALKVISIPVNFFIPVPGHAIRTPNALTPEYCLRALIVFRLVNPDSEIRIGAGREGHLRGLQSTALMVANSLFASGYLNVQGSNLEETRQLISDAGFVPEFEGDMQMPELASAKIPYARENFPELLKFK